MRQVRDLLSVDSVTPVSGACRHRGDLPVRIDRSRLVGRGAEADVYPLTADTVFRVERNYSPGSDERAVTAVRVAAAGGIPVPRLVQAVEVGGIAGIVMESLDPQSLLDRLGRRPWDIMMAGRLLGAIHARIHAVSADSTLPDLRHSLIQRIIREGEPDRPCKTLAERVDQLPSGDQLLHGDFNPANLLRRLSREEWVAVDWGGATRGDPAADVARTLETIAAGAPPASLPGSLHRLALAARPVLASAYLRSYVRGRALDLELVRRWRRVWRCVGSIEERPCG